MTKKQKQYDAVFLPRAARSRHRGKAVGDDLVALIEARIEAVTAEVRYLAGPAPVWPAQVVAPAASPLPARCGACAGDEAHLHGAVLWRHGKELY